jgi:DsbC/DsbD-like thiol-disulfide interchange protein
MRNFFLLIAMIVTSQLLAQNPNPVKWSFYSLKDKEAEVYTIYAKATIEDGWHVFSPTPGGDGLLIPTQLTFDHPEKFREMNAMQVEGKEISKNMEGVGLVNYYEHEVIFKINVEPYQAHSVTGNISYQLCNDMMCLPPTEVPFNIKL